MGLPSKMQVKVSYNKNGCFSGFLYLMPVCKHTDISILICMKISPPIQSLAFIVLPSKM